MPVIGFNLSSIEARRKNIFMEGEMKVNSTPKINSVKETTLPSLNKKAISMEFDFTTNYEPNVADIRVSGEILYVSDQPAKIIREWKNKKKLSDGIATEVLNHLFRRCLLKVANIAEDLQLPAPIPMPAMKQEARA